jgi:signal transduction histidine kinase
MKHPSIAAKTAPQGRVVPIDSKATEWPILTPPARSREQQRQKSMNSIGWLSTSIIHDLRNPLATVFAGAEMLLELDPASPQAKRLVANIYKAARSMRDLLASLPNTNVENRSTTEICGVHDVVLAASRAALLRGEVPVVELLLGVPPEFEISVERARVEKVFFNLITNALEAMPHGGVICIRARNVNNYVVIEVEDSGPGIPRAIRDRLFEPFATAGKAYGLGLGLALSRQVVLDQGGDMWIEPASGARFVISLPLHSTEMNKASSALSGSDSFLSQMCLEFGCECPSPCLAKNCCRPPRCSG